MTDLFSSPAEDRTVGALLGLAVGDAVGTTLEFKRPGTFEPIDDMVGGGPFSLPAGAWTDDTSMALCLAESLVDVGDMDLVDQLRRYVMWRRDGHLSSTGRCFDIGGTTSSQLSRFTRTGEAIDPAPDQESAANGSLMRLAPVAIRWHESISASAERSGESSRTTHAAVRPVDACRLMGAVISALIGGDDLAAALERASEAVGELHPQVRAIAAGAWRHKAPPAIRGTGFCIDALEAALWAVDGAVDFRDAVLRAANLGDDADTTAAIAGQIAGARWGASGIPTAWIDKVVLRSRIIELARQLYRAGAPGEVADERGRWFHDDFVHAWWVDDDVLAGEYPMSLDDPVRSHEKVNLLVDTGVRTFVDLTHRADDMAPYEPILSAAAEARRLDLRRVAHPIPDMGVIDDADYDVILETIAEARRRGRVYVHCWGGMGRTSTVVGCLLQHTDGLSFDATIARIDDLRALTRKARQRAPQSSKQFDVLRRRAERSTT